MFRVHTVIPVACFSYTYHGDGMRNTPIALFIVATLLSLILVLRADSGPVYTVSRTGSDANDGIRTPVRTIQRAVDLASPRGGTVRILPGVYRETVHIGSRGGTDPPLTLRGESDGSGRVIITGEESLDGIPWVNCTDTNCPDIPAVARPSVVTVPLPHDELPTAVSESDLFESQLPLARAAGTDATDPDRYHEHWWQQAGTGNDDGAISDPVHLTGHGSLVGSRLLVIDGMDRCGTFMYIKSVVSHDRTSGRIYTDSPIGAVMYGRKESGGGTLLKYRAENSPSLLDQENEWYAGGGMLYFHRGSAAPPDSLRVGRRRIGIRIDRSHVRVSGLTIRGINDQDYSGVLGGAVVIVPSVNRSDIRLESLGIEHAGYGIYASTEQGGALTGLSVRRSAISGVTRSAVTVLGGAYGTMSRITVDGIRVDASGFPYSEPAVMLRRATRVSVRGNVIGNSASYGIHVTGFEKENSVARAVTVSGNRVTHACRNLSGCSAIKVFGGRFADTSVSQNTVSNNTGWSFCRERSEGSRGDADGIFLSNTSGIRVTGNRSSGNGGAGILIYTRQLPSVENIITGNTVTGSDYGIALIGDGSMPDTDPASYQTRHDGSVITGNVIRDNDIGLVLDPARPRRLTVHTNTYRGNSTFAIVSGRRYENARELNAAFPFWQR